MPSRITGVLAAALVVGLGAAGVGPGARAQPAAADPDWPCVQRLVPSLSAGMMWAGPPVDAAMAARADDEDVIRLGEAIAQRRVPLDEAEGRIEGFAAGLAPGGRGQALAALFGVTLKAVNAERGQIINGIKRFSRRQRALGDEIAAVGAKLRRDDAGADPDLGERRAWGLRLYDEREATLSYLCEQPVVLEQRAFALARAIAERIE